MRPLYSSTHACLLDQMHLDLTPLKVGHKMLMRRFITSYKLCRATSEVGTTHSDISTGPSSAYQHRQAPAPPPPSPAAIPSHLAVIMDGNSRWARARGQPAVAGHRAGVAALRKLVQSCHSYKIPALTVFALSSENWNKRDHGEISLLLNLLETSLLAELDDLIQKGVKLQFIGEFSLLPTSLKQAIQHAELATAHNHALHLTVALSYSGRQDIAHAAQQLAVEVVEGRMHPSDITPEAISEKLSTSRHLPEARRHPDLIIRTSGEQRLSNFLLWEAAYSELYFTECNWPDFGEKELREALREYGQRERRFGGRRKKEQEQ